MENQVEMEEKTRLINQVLELQHTLEGMEYSQSATYNNNRPFLKVVQKKLYKIATPYVVHMQSIPY